MREPAASPVAVLPAVAFVRSPPAALVFPLQLPWVRQLTAALWQGATKTHGIEHSPQAALSPRAPPADPQASRCTQAAAAGARRPSLSTVFPSPTQN